MAKTIQEQIADMEARCNQLEELQKLFEKMVKNEYGVDAKKLHKILEYVDYKFPYQNFLEIIK